MSIKYHPLPVLAALSLTGLPAFAQGPLTPPAAPGPTYKTLTEVEPRTIISELPFTISASGSYYLGASLTIDSAAAGITISVSNVTLDLNGFSLIGAAGSLDGIVVSGAQNQIRIQNGIVTGWEGDGIDLETATRADLKDLTVSSCAGDGVRLGANSSVKSSRLASNGSDGLETLASGALLTKNILEGNTGHGLHLANDQASVEGNHCTGNTDHGILVAGDSNTVQDNKTTDNGTGFAVTGAGNAILRNYTIRNGENAESNQVLTAVDNQYDLLISDIPETINVPCNARLTGNVINSQGNADGITIDTDNVTLELGGFSIIGSGHTVAADLPRVNVDGIGRYIGVGVSSDDGIVVLGSQENITIRNGSVVAWGGDGINALNADFSLFEDLHLSFNAGDGLVADFNCIIRQCTAHGNGIDGLEGDDGTVITHCSVGGNGDNGIQTSDGCQVSNCASFDNNVDGFDLAAGSTITDCSASDNGIFGFDIALGGTCKNSTAYDNGNLSSNPSPPPIDDPTAASVSTGHGFDMASSCILKDCHASNNNGHGVRTFANSYITGCKFHENDFDGIRISSTDVVVENNVVTDNDRYGLQATTSGSLILRNRAAGNVRNYRIDANTAAGPIVDVTGVGDISGTANANHPQANFSY